MEHVTKFCCNLVGCIIAIAINALVARYLLEFPPFLFTYKQWFLIVAVFGGMIEVFSRRAKMD